ncbi:MAG: peptidylprolyl isomerase [Nitrospirota bacterium]|nr:peptidylprolyl isomerase [Nitrospirota bacterium]
MEQTVNQGDVIGIHYTGKLTDDSVFDSSEGRDPLEFTAGGEEVIPGMSAGVLGMKLGEQRTLTIPPEQAYGEYNPELQVKVPASQLPEGVSPGDVLGDNQQPGRMWTVREIGGENATIDANHPLAGQTLVFDVEIAYIGANA